MDRGWYFEYEQCPLDKRGVYRFDHEPVTDRQWRPINSLTNASYRVCDGIVQVITPGEMLTCDDVEACHRWLEEAGPLATEDELEIHIARHPRGFEMWSHWLMEADGIVFAGFKPHVFSRAYERLREAEEHTSGE